MVKMAIRVHVLLSWIVILFSFFPLKSLASDGIVTFYGSAPYTGKAFYGNKNPYGVWIVAASDQLWNGGAVRGKRFTITCTGPTNPYPKSCNGGSVTVTIINHCPPRGFAAIADPVAREN